MRPTRLPRLARRGAPASGLLVTSRELLRISGERGYPAPPLDVVTGAALFEDRARMHRPELAITDDARAAIREICGAPRRPAAGDRARGRPHPADGAQPRSATSWDGAWTSPVAPATRRSGSGRSEPRSRGATISWPETERRLFRRLAVFAGGWTLDAAATLADPDGDLGLALADGLSP